MSNGVSAIEKSQGQKSRGEAADKDERPLKQDERSFGFARRQLQSAGVSARGESSGQKRHGEPTDKTEKRLKRYEKTFQLRPDAPEFHPDVHHH